MLIAFLFLAPGILSAADFPVWQKGMCYVTWSKDAFRSSKSDESLKQMKSLGTEWVSLVSTWYQDEYDSTIIMPHKSKTPSDSSIVHAIRKIHSLGMKVMLKPHIDLLDTSGGKWRGEISFNTEEEWESWFKSYTDFILHYAKIAKEEGVEFFCIGTELTNAAISQPKGWRKLIQDVRKVYSGYLTYAANWYEEYFRIEFWDLLDYAAVDPYFPLIEKAQPTLAELKESWELWARLLDEWYEKVKKPVIFAEIGYKSCVQSADQPWLSTASKVCSLTIQQDAYTALLETFWDKPWFYGVYWWYWGTSSKMGGEFHRGFTPQNKPAQEIIKKWYSKPAPHS